MRRIPSGWRVAASVLLAGCLAAGVRADTIVLKNGHRIVGTNVTRENGKVSCETPAGRISLPESLVQRIEKDNLGTNPAAADLQIGPPPLDVAESAGDADSAAHAVVHDDVIDRQALAELDSLAAGGNAQAIVRAVAAESAASQFEFRQDNLDAALDHAQHALEMSPGQLTLLLNVAYLHQRLGEYSEALDYLQRARRVAPDSPDVAKLTGWAYYGLNRLPEAVSEWKRAEELRPDPEVAQALAKAEKDLEVEGSFSENQSAHFILRYDGAEAPELAGAALPLLEDDFREIAAILRFTPAEPIGVVFYTNQAFADITQAPGWVGALNDGRIRVPVQGLDTVTPELARVLKHELTHSFVNGMTQGRCPVWLNEGVAQWMEGKRSAGAAAQLVSLYENHQEPSLSALEGSWLNLPTDFASTAYAWSLAVVESVEAASPGDVERLLETVAGESSPEAAVRGALHMSYADLNAATADYLRQTYIH